MIDFRYHLVSIVAVFLALGIGVLMGSAVLGENLVDSLRGDLEGISARNEELRRETTELRARLEADEEFARAVKPALISGALTSESVVLISIDGADGDLLAASREAIEEAGGTVTTAITVLDKLAFEGEPEADQLALLLGSVDTEPARLRTRLGREMGVRLADAAAEDASEAEGRRTEEFLEALRSDGFLDVDRVGDETPLVPSGAAFLVLLGGEEEAPFPIGELVNGISTSLASRGTPVVVAEAALTVWGGLDILRTDPEAEASVTTVDQADTTSGQIAVALSIREVIEGISGRHYGVGSGTEGIIPQPSPES